MYLKHRLIKPKTIEARLYQEILAMRSIERGNTLIVVPTALGKTIIAMLVAVHFLEKYPDKKVLFLAPTKPLVNQHKKRFEELTEIKRFALFTGETKKQDREIMWKKAKVVFATPQTIESAMFAQQIDLKDVSLIIFDECHRAVGDYSYVFIADQFVRKNPEAHIIGLTASPGGTREKIQEICQNLYIKNIETRTETDEDVKPYVYAKKTEWILVELPQDFKEIKKLLEETMKEILKKLKDAGYTKNTSLKWYNRTNLLKLQGYLLKIKGKEPHAWKALSDVAALMKLYHAHELLETQGIEQVHEYFEKLGKEQTKAAKWIISQVKIRKAMVLVEKILDQGIEHPKITELVRILNNFNGQAIVFTHYRTTAKKVVDVLNKKNIPAEQFIGQTTKEGTKGLRQKEQIALIKRFRHKGFRVLVATSIGEEGLDIPNVDLVVFYEPVPSEIRKIQRAGRTGRHAPGHVIILITKGTRDEAYYWASKHREKEMMKVLNEIKQIGFKTQKTLEEYAQKSEKPIIYVDFRERQSGITRALMKKDVLIKSMELPIGDFLVSDRCVIERKSTNDFIQSIIDGRLFQQARELKENFSNPVILIEGEDLYNIRKVHPHAIMGAIVALAVDFGIPLVWTKTMEESADMLVVFAKREQEEKQRHVRLRGEKHVMTDEEQMIYIVESLPGVGGRLARELLKTFKTVENIFKASDKELKRIGQIGEKKAKEIRRILTKEFRGP